MTKSTKLKRFTRTSTSKGFTLLELVIGGAVSLVVLSVTLGLVVEQRRLFLGDQTRTDFDQNLRTTAQFISTDINLAGSRVENTSTLPVVRILEGSSVDDPDTLILQRKLIEDSLRVCQDVATNATEILVTNRTRNDCDINDGSGDGLDDSLTAFKDYRCDPEDSTASCVRGDNDDEANYGNVGNEAITNIDSCDNECIYGYIHDPATQNGDFFLYTDETFEVESSGESRNRLKVIPLNSSGSFSQEYTVSNDSDSSNDPIIYILEEKKYGLCDGVFQVVVNRYPNYGEDCPMPENDPKPIRLVNSIENFKVRVNTSTSNSSLSSFNETLSEGHKFSEIESIEVLLVSEANPKLPTQNNAEIFSKYQIETKNKRTLSTKFYPRNVGSSLE